MSSLGFSDNLATSLHAGYVFLRNLLLQLGKQISQLFYCLWLKIMMI